MGALPAVLGCVRLAGWCAAFVSRELRHCGWLHYINDNKSHLHCGVVCRLRASRAGYIPPGEKKRLSQPRQPLALSPRSGQWRPHVDFHCMVFSDIVLDGVWCDKRVAIVTRMICKCNSGGETTCMFVRMRVICTSDEKMPPFLSSGVVLSCVAFNLFRRLER